MTWMSFSVSPRKSRSSFRAPCSRRARPPKFRATSRCGRSISARKATLKVALKATVKVTAEASMPNWALDLHDVRAGYGETVVIEDIRFALGPSETVSIIGRNGVGKTTLLATIMGHTTLHGGRLALHDVDISRMATYRRVTQGLGYVPQEREIFPSLTLRENLEVAARPGPWTVETVFGLFPRLAERANNMGNQLSGGEQQMLAIGRALIGNPTVLLMDE